MRHVAVDLAALQAKHFRDVLEPHAIRVAVDEEHRRFGGLKLVGAEVVPFRSCGEDPLDEIRKVVRSMAYPHPQSPCVSRLTVANPSCIWYLPFLMPTIIRTSGIRSKAGAGCLDEAIFWTVSTV